MYAVPVGLEPISSEEEQMSEEKRIERVWEHCMRSECVQGRKLFDNLSSNTWETRLLDICLEGMAHYQEQKFEDSSKVFEGIFAAHHNHKGVWLDIEKFQMDWVIKQFCETAYKISPEAYKDVTRRVATITDGSGPISLANQAQRLLYLGKLAEAEQKCEESLRALESSPYPENLVKQCEADTINILIAVKNFLGKFDEAKLLFEKIFSENLDIRLQVNLLRKQAEVALLHKDFAKADSDLLRCEKLLQDSPDAALKFTTLLQRAIYYQRNNQFAEAVDIYQQMIELKEKELSLQEKTFLQWNVGMMLHRMEQQSQTLTLDRLDELLEFLEGREDLLEWSFPLIETNLIENLLNSTYEKIVHKNEKTDASEIVAYVPYGFDVL